MTLELQQVARAMEAEGQAPAMRVSGWSVDTRTQKAGDVYFALRGPNHDGHDFVKAALEKGAAAVVVEAGCRRRAAASLRRWRDTLARPAGPGSVGARASGAAGRWGVTGSAGKTTTKDAIAHLLAVDMAGGQDRGQFQ